MGHTFVIVAFAAMATLAAGAAERILHIDEIDHLAQWTEGFNEGAFITETRCNITAVGFATDKKADLAKTFFKFAESPKEKAWSLLFKFRFVGDPSREFGVKLYFGDPAKPETRLLTIREDGSFFEGGTKPAAPKEGDAGFLFGYGEAGFGAWNRGAITVEGGKATFWVYRGGKLVKEAEGKLPAMPLVGWNLSATGEKTNIAFDRVILVDGAARPYERGDLTEVLAELAQKPLGAWDAAFGGAPVTADTPVAFAGTANEFQFRAPFEKDEKVTFTFRAADGKTETVDFSAGNHGGETSYRVFKGGKFVDEARRVVATNGVLSISGRRRGFYAVPPIGGMDMYETPEIAEIAAARNVFTSPGNRAYRLAVVPETDGRPVYRLLLDNQLFKTIAFDQPLREIVISGKGVEAQSRLGAAPAPKGPETWQLPIAKEGFKLERVRENLGSYALECNGYLSRDGLYALPSSCLFNVPRKQWGKAVARCRIDKTAPKEFVPVIVARLTQFNASSGRSIAMAQEEIDLSKEDDPRIVKKGDEYEVTFDLDVAAIMDLTSMKDGLSGEELPSLHFEFTGPVWEKNRYYIDSGRSPAEELRSSVVVTWGSLIESPVWFRVAPDRTFALYYPGETPKAKVELKVLDGGKYTFSAEVKYEDGQPDFDERRGKTTVWQNSFDFSGDTVKTLEFPKNTGDFGHYTVAYRITDAKGAVVQKFNASYGLLPENTREAGYESPYYSWNFHGAHGTARAIEDWAPSYDFLGVKRTEFSDKTPETNALMKAHGFTNAQFPYIRVNAGEEEAAKEKMRALVKAFPHCKEALVFHESGGGPFPNEAWGGKTELTDGVLKRQANRVEAALRTAKCWREVDPSVKLIIGNSGESYGIVGELCRGGFPKEYVDFWGEESVGLTMPPEMVTAYVPWVLKKIARTYGYPERMDCPWEWKTRTERYERSERAAAAVCLRDSLIAHALGCRTVPVEAGMEVGNSYADTIWCGGAFTRWPLAYPRENALGVATLTLLLDKAKFTRQLETGSLTAYALEFQGKNGEWIYPIWTARGETMTYPKWNGCKEADCTYVTMTGRRFELKARVRDEGEVIEARKFPMTDEPGYIVSKTRIDSFEVFPIRVFSHENPADRANTTVVPLVSADEVELVEGEDRRIDPKFADTPFRPGKFAVRSALDDDPFEETTPPDDGFGPCIEIEHLSQEACPEIMQEYVLLKIKNPQVIEKPFNTIGVWAKGNSNWGHISFEITDAEGEKWFSSGIGGLGCYTYDWPFKLSFNYEFWNFLQVPLTKASDVRIVGPGENEWLWTRDGTGNGKIDWPVKVTALGISQYGRTLDLLEMKKGSPVIRLKDIQVR